MPLMFPIGLVGFCQALEEDAQERAERRKERERVGREKKRKGNEAFRKEDYDSAVKHYTEAIQQTPWDVTLYTNRALVSGKLELTCSFHIQPCHNGYSYKAISNHVTMDIVTYKAISNHVTMDIVIRPYPTMSQWI